MSDENDAALEALADTMTDAQIAAEVATNSDLMLGRLAGVAEVKKELLCGGVKEAKGETDGTCRIYNAALNEFDKRLSTDPLTR